jgi:hypothetical protein
MSGEWPQRSARPANEDWAPRAEAASVQQTENAPNANAASEPAKQLRELTAPNGEWVKEMWRSIRACLVGVSNDTGKPKPKPTKPKQNAANEHEADAHKAKLTPQRVCTCSNFVQNGSWCVA